MTRRTNWWWGTSMLATEGQWHRPVVPIGADEAVEDYAFLLGRHVDLPTLEFALAEGRRLGVPAVRVLLARSWVRASDYVIALSTELAARFPDRGGARHGVSAAIDATQSTPLEVIAEAWRVYAEGAQPLLVEPAALDASSLSKARRRLAYAAGHQLLRTNPELSAGHRMWLWQLLAVVSAPGVVAGGLFVLPEATLVAILAMASVPVFFVVGLRLVALLALLTPRGHPRAAGGPNGTAHFGIDDVALPTYALLVPLYDEAQVLPGLVQAIADIDYPAEKLDAVLILEESDQATRAAADALALPGFMRVVVVPECQPRTKPKALNYALRSVTSTYVVVYDAEDAPDPDQLRKAVAAFGRGGPVAACLQARLTIYNPRGSWLTRQFTLEYAALFEGLLPALSRLGLPMPLGGTSNHFDRSILVRMGGWDAHNVTEDADLGMRLARARHRVDVLASDTGEEAPLRFNVWLRQRTRWQKGFMQTWAVHMRRPLRLLAEVGPLGFIGVNAIIGGHIVSALIHPFCVLVLAVAAWQGLLLHEAQSPLEAMLIGVALFNFAVGYLSALALGAVAVVRRGRGWLVWHLVTTPLYWWLVSLAAWRALFQFMREPYRWEKTPHAPRPAHGRRRQTGPQ